MSIKNFYFTSIETEVFQLLKSKEIDIIVSDFIIPDKDGIKLLEEVHALNKRILLVLRTAYVIHPKSKENERCLNSRIKILSKHEGFDYLRSNLQQIIDSRSQNSVVLPKQARNSPTIHETSSSFSLMPSKILDFLFNKIPDNILSEKEKQNDSKEWQKVTEIPTKVLKVLYDNVQCECLVNASLKRTQIREFPKIMFDNILDLQENKYVIIKIKLKPGFSCTEILDAKDLNYQKYFEIDGLDKLDEFKINKL